MKRYWYVIFALFVVLVLLLSFLSFKSGKGNELNPFKFVSNNREVENNNKGTPNTGSMGDGETKIQDKDGKVHTNVTYFKGFVRSWRPETGEIELENSVKEKMIYTIYPESTVVFTPVVGNRNRLLMLKNKESIHWKSGFCKGDLVTVTFDGKQMISVSNDGDRLCGFKGAEQ